MGKTKHGNSWFYNILVLVVTAFVFHIRSGSANSDDDIHIVYLGCLPDHTAQYSPSSHHLTLLRDVLTSGVAENSLVRSYTRSFNGFAARLTSKEREKMDAKKEVVSIFPNIELNLQTTSSWDFLGLPQNTKRNPKIESDIIIGVIDTGISPDSLSFSDTNLKTPSPSKWKGTCQNFTCNKKLIGVKNYVSNEDPMDIVGHGSHTASTAAGIPVTDASFFGLAKGTARGPVPSARIAAYKVCTTRGCQDKDILAAFDDAIADGVDIISISLGRSDSAPFDKDSIAIGAFHAMQRNVLTVHSAGNSGPDAASIASNAPWLFTVAASSTDRDIVDKVTLSDGQTFTGKSINGFTLPSKNYTLIYGKQATTICHEDDAKKCYYDCLDSKLVKNKILICDDSDGAQDAHRAGAIGVVTLNDRRDDVAFMDSLPTSRLNFKDFDSVRAYYNSSKNPQAYVQKSVAVNSSESDHIAPIVASFSSRGPNSIAQQILKPDVSAPGIDILAAFSLKASVTDDPNDKRSIKYSIMSGTSMACPHVTGAATFVKSFHPDWSTSAIKSALMTTTNKVNTAKERTGRYEEGEFAYGAGNINPVKALNPGLVYEASEEDYKKLVCFLGIKSFFGPCPNQTALKGYSPTSLNYPSMQSVVKANQPFEVLFPRTVKNVGAANSSYIVTVEILSPEWKDVHVDVKPRVLQLKALNEEQSFVVCVSGKGLKAGTKFSASLVWSDGLHSVRSPIVVYTDVV